MGVPSYFFWLVKKFEEQILLEIESRYLTEKDRPDNLFLDWNCGIHPAIKKPGLNTLESKIQAVLDYLDKIFDLVKPRKLFYIAIDGVAPRAKMQQQRKRRFKSVQDAIYMKKLMEKHGMLKNASPNDCLNLTDEEKEWDYNMISPGTIFMDLLSKEIKKHLTDAKYGKIKIIVSDSSIPGEGEHKIMKYIREETGMSEKNMVYGLDSDLIFLSLINFRPGMHLLREKVEFGKKFKVGAGASNDKLVIGGEQDIKTDVKVIGWVLLSIDKLRDVFLQIFNPYLSLRELENFGIFSSKSLDQCSQAFYKDYDYQTYVEQMLHERFYHDPSIEGKNIIIDYIFMSFMLGNDFLPAIVSLQIKEGGLDHLIRAYKMTMITMRQNLIILETEAPASSSITTSGYREVRTARHFKINTPFFIRLLEICTSFEIPILKATTRNKLYRIGNFKNSRKWNEASPYEKDMLDLDYLEDKVPDYINLGETGWAARYYDVHFHLKDRNEYESKKYKMGICDQYIRGMIWTLQYYLTGQPDWTWEYPFHSSPTVHDLLEYVKSPNINNSYKIYRELAIAAGTMTDFENTKKTSERIAIGGLIKANKITKPVSPLEQLMCILPPASSHLLPEPVQQLIKSDALSVYYPEDFALDVFGHRYRWEAHPLLPHIPINEIKAAVSSIEPYLTKEELERNSIGDIFVT